MAINTGVNVSKVVSSFVFVRPPGVYVSKVVASFVFVKPNVTPPVWGAAGLGDGYVTIPYSQSFDLYPAASPTTYTVVSGALPGGLSLSNVSGDIGKIDGTPTTDGVFSFTLRATNAYGYKDQVFTITINLLSGSGGGFGWIS